MGSTTIEQPKAPSAPTTADSVKAYVANMPAMYQAQMDWAPKIAAQDVSMLQQYLPQITALQQQLQTQYAPQQAAQQWALQEQYAPLMAAQQQQLQQQYEPGAYAATQNLGAMMTPEYLSGQGAFNVAQSPMMDQLSSTMTPEWLTGYSAQNAPGMDAARNRVVQQSRDAWADRGLAQSGMSAEDETRMVSEFEFPYAMQQEQLTQQTLANRMGQASALANNQLANQQNSWSNYYNNLAQRQNTALQLAGRYATPTQSAISTPNVQLSNYQAPNVMNGYNYGQVANNMQSSYGTQAGIYGNQLSSYTQLANQNPWLSAGAGILGSIGGGWAGNGFKIG